jgi:light-regulated signal transduction histidine kinase (bacteriophytochrome)
MLKAPWICCMRIRETELAYQIEPDTIRHHRGRPDAPGVNQLAVNAVKFTDQGEVVVSLSLMENASHLAPRQTFHFSVRDTGIGIPHDRMGRLFQAFSQVDASTAPLRWHRAGLAISQRLCALMGGEMWAESPAPEGDDLVQDARTVFISLSRPNPASAQDARTCSENNPPWLANAC